MILKISLGNSKYEKANISTNNIITIMYDLKDSCIEIRTFHCCNQSLSFKCSKDEYNNFLEQFYNALRNKEQFFEYDF